MSIAENSPVDNLGVQPMEGPALMGQVSERSVAWQQFLQGRGLVDEFKQDRMWFMYPIPRRLLRTKGSDYYLEIPSSSVGEKVESIDGDVLDGQSEAIVTAAAEGDELSDSLVGESQEEQSEVVAVYNMLDYRLHRSTSKRHRYAKFSEQFDGWSKFSKKLLEYGDLGYDTKLIASELMGNNFGNVGENCDRWFVFSKRGEGENLVIELEYFCLSAISEATFNRFRDMFDPANQSNRNERMQGGELSDDENAGETGRGTSILVTLAEESTIEWINHTTRKPRSWTARQIMRILNKGEAPLEKRGARLHFTIRAKDIPDNPGKSGRQLLEDWGIDITGLTELDTGQEPDEN